jgi:hypothetical protein
MSALTNGRLVHTGRARAAISRTDKEVQPSGAVTYRRVVDHYTEATVELWVDIDSIMRQLAERAVSAKGKAARALNGAVVVRARNHREVA